jgi:glutathione S-transferase
LGDQFTLLDAAIAPFAVRDYILAHHRRYDRAQASEKWKQYAEKLSERESVKKTSSVSPRCRGQQDGLLINVQELKYYEEIYQRYLKNEAQSEVAKATRGGQNLP